MSKIGTLTRAMPADGHYVPKAEERESEKLNQKRTYPLTFAKTKCNLTRDVMTMAVTVIRITLG